ncbi:DUF799 domain-containing protein [Teredinibacter sp. KSP-S5-2]|uniref:DUF799 domain-containing protein n=1 Tax=Teredinibacter sp. KSP-S5-2 TaxID=3034506 RepID=UPI00293491C9|nr:GNA1162 family protein [Teredinibacter sp. KSP-S5-2]WNO07775.1 DUF799 family lipoprotein [Teredinibacter sp. KSP-S5-2]
MINRLRSFFLHCMAIFAIGSILAGCSSIQTQNNTELVQNRPRSILVIPPLNNSVEVNAPYTFISTITRPLAEKGYYVFPVAVIDHFFKENGLPTPGEMNGVPLDKIREHIGADAVLYTTIEDWGQKYLLFNTVTVVNAKLNLVDTRTGTVLWTGRARAERSQGDGQLLQAIVSHIVESLTDSTPELAREANRSAINGSGSGLVDGPYKDVQVTP